MEEKRAIITESMNKLDKEFLDKITNTITEGLAAAENIDITVLSNVMCMSSSTLYRKVKALTGMSPSCSFTRFFTSASPMPVPEA